MLVLESEQQGTGKSTGFEALFSAEFFADTGLHIGEKDSYQSLRGKWGYEFGELDSLKGREVTRVKNFVSARWTATGHPTGAEVAIFRVRSSSAERPTRPSTSSTHRATGDFGRSAARDAWT